VVDRSISTCLRREEDRGVVSLSLSSLFATVAFSSFRANVILVRPHRMTALAAVDRLGSLACGRTGACAGSSVLDDISAPLPLE
jgi:hypothetical protein